MADRYLIIAHPDGRSYGVLPADFHAIYETAGFVVVSYEGGDEYTPPAASPAPSATTKPSAPPVGSSKAE